MEITHTRVPKIKAPPITVMINSIFWLHICVGPFFQHDFQLKLRTEVSRVWYVFCVDQPPYCTHSHSVTQTNLLCAADSLLRYLQAFSRSRTARPCWNANIHQQVYTNKPTDPNLSHNNQIHRRARAPYWRYILKLFSHLHLPLSIGSFFQISHVWLELITYLMRSTYPNHLISYDANNTIFGEVQKLRTLSLGNSQHFLLLHIY